MTQHLPASEFLQTCTKRVLLDVRAPGEYRQGHIPGAYSFPLFSDAERAEIGTLYKQKGKDYATLRGLEIVGPKLASFVKEAKKLARGSGLAVHCWRGGQRSQSMAWLFRQSGLDVVTLDGGYKAFRRYVLDSFDRHSLNLIVLGGKTGTGKTNILHALQAQGEQVIDLEGLAHHKGSAFGHIGATEQPTVEQFENDLFEKILELDPERRVWIENESQSIGRVFVPQTFWLKMKKAPLYNIEVPLERRIQNLVDEYTGISLAALEAAFHKIERKLGGQHLKAALEALRLDDPATAAAIALRYYDKTYQFGLENNPSPEIKMLNFSNELPEEIALRCRQIADARKLPSGNTVPL
ncbi:MAG: tRNA 2-selenouridine(34) synthase MnmH [Saprospiraceae bacterium]|nr:tRNA 2-selenouridine(34) synthase MnmH [Lewinellaceae bacterium]